MAVMNPIQRRLLMERMRRDPRLAALMAARGEGGGGLAELAGLQQGPANLAELAGMAPPAQVVTPAQPAPVQPGAEIKAPTDRAAGEDVPIPQLRPPEPLPNNALGRAQQKAIAADIAARAARVLSPEEEAIYAKQNERYGEGLEELEQDKKRAGWEALAAAGFKMAQSQSPYFMSALASGMEAGLNGFNARKMDRAERKARLQAAQEQVALQQIAAKNANEQRERERQQGMDNSVLTQLRLEQGGREADLGESILPFRKRIEGPLAEEALRADIAARLANANQSNAAARRSDRWETSGGGGGGSQRGKTVTANRVSELRENYAKATEKALERKAEWEAVGKPQEGPELAAWVAAEKARQIYAEAWRDAVPGARQLQRAREAADAKPAKRNAPNVPKVGEVVQGYRFKGGNPADRKNWEKVR